MGFFDKMSEPVLLKEGQAIEGQIESLKILEKTLNAEGQRLIQQDVKNLEAGFRGEKSIIFELMNSHMPMYILNDIYLEYENLCAQIDFLIVTKKLCFVIECKNLYGDIEITSTGDFIRKTEYDGYKRKEGMYSPITQNERHIDLLKKIKIDNNTNLIIKFLAKKLVDKFYKGVIVLANPKTILNIKYAKKGIKDQVVRLDQLASFIKTENKKADIEASNDEQLFAWAQSFLALHKDIEKDYISKYDNYKLENNCKSDHATSSLQQTNIPEGDQTQISEILISKLKKYRLQKSREENVKPYFIFNDNQLYDLLNKMPEDKEMLLKVSGFGEIKTKKYGEDILKILHESK